MANCGVWVCTPHAAVSFSYLGSALSVADAGGGGSRIIKEPPFLNSRQKVELSFVNEGSEGEAELMRQYIAKRQLMLNASNTLVN